MRNQQKQKENSVLSFAFYPFLKQRKEKRKSEIEGDMSRINAHAKGDNAHMIQTWFLLSFASQVHTIFCLFLEKIHPLL